MSASYTKGDRVRWDWGQGTASGTVVERFERRVQRTLKGSKIVRRGSKDNPALLVEQSDGDQALKLASEVRKG